MVFFYFLKGFLQQLQSMDQNASPMANQRSNKTLTIKKCPVILIKTKLVDESFMLISDIYNSSGLE